MNLDMKILISKLIILKMPLAYYIIYINYAYRFPGLWSDLNEQHALSMGMEPEYAKLAGELSTNLLLENLTAITVNGIRGYKNIKTGEILYDSDVIAGSGIGNIATRDKILKIGNDILFKKEC